MPPETARTRKDIAEPPETPPVKPEANCGRLRSVALRTSPAPVTVAPEKSLNSPFMSPNHFAMRYFWTVSRSASESAAP